MTREWLETIRALAHKSTLGELLLIAPPGSAESDNMRRRLDLLADFAQHVVESVDDDELRAAKESREAFATGSRSEPPTKWSFRLLEIGDRLEAGDEFLDVETKTWDKVSPVFWGKEYLSFANPPHRRPIP